MSKRLVDTIRQERSQSLAESVSIASIFPPYSSDAESETSSASNGSSPRFSCSIDTLFPPAWSPSQSPPRISFSIETFFPPARSPSQSDGSENYEEIFPIDPFISTSSRRTRPMRQTVVLHVTMDGQSQRWFSPIMKGDHTRKKAMRIAVGLSGVESATIKGQDKDQIELKGWGIDTVKLATLLRKKVGHASIVSVAEEKKEEKEDEKKEELKIQYMESLLGTDWRSIKGQALAPGSSIKQPSRKQFIDSTSLSDSKSTEASTSMSMDELCAVDSASVPSTSRAAEVIEYPRHPSAASSTLVELTSRLDFIKKRRSQLMEQLHNLDLNYGATSSQDFVYRPSSPPWN